MDIKELQKQFGIFYDKFLEAAIKIGEELCPNYHDTMQFDFSDMGEKGSVEVTFIRYCYNGDCNDECDYTIPACVVDPQELGTYINCVKEKEAKEREIHQKKKADEQVAKDKTLLIQHRKIVADLEDKLKSPENEK